MLNRRGSRMDPWATPHVISFWSDEKLRIDTSKLYSISPHIFVLVSSHPNSFFCPFISVPYVPSSNKERIEHLYFVVLSSYFTIVH